MRNNDYQGTDLTLHLHAISEKDSELADVAKRVLVRDRMVNGV